MPPTTNAAQAKSSPAHRWQTVRLGAVLLASLPVLIDAYREEAWLLPTDVENDILHRGGRITTGVRPALARLQDIQVENPYTGDIEPVLLAQDHPDPALVWTNSRGTSRPRRQVKLTGAGYLWALEVLDSSTRGRGSRGRLTARLRSAAHSARGIFPSGASPAPA